MSGYPAPLAHAYATCEQFARSHYENFPVASRLLPSGMRPHVSAVYAFARTADDIADEGSVAPETRRQRLSAWQRRLHDAIEHPKTIDAAARRDDLIVAALGHSVRMLELPPTLFDDLISAFAQDTMTARYDSWADVFDYCRRSANPIGRLVLRIAGHADERFDRSSDALCTALQLTNFWQDFGRDWRAGRLYVPRDVVLACGASESDLVAGRFDHAWVRAIDACCAVTAGQFDEGRAVCEAVRGRLRLELRLTWLGGRRILQRITGHGGSLLDWRPMLTAADVPRMIWDATCWKAAA